MESLKQRIRECKSWTQRKKDHSDPIIYPAYFIRGNKHCKDARIDSYFKRVVSHKSRSHLRLVSDKNIQSVDKGKGIKYAKRIDRKAAKLLLPGFPPRAEGPPEGSVK